MNGARTASAALAAAILAAPIVVTVMLAQSGVAFCNRRIDLDAMAGMDMSMPATHGPMLCPIVLMLVAGFAALTGAAVVALVCTRERAVVGRSVARRFARLPPLRTAAVLATLSAVPLGGIGASESTLRVAGVAGLIATAIVALGALAGAAFLILAGRWVLALGRRVLVRVIALLVRAGAPSVAHFVCLTLRISSRRVHVLSAARGLRAPPFEH